MRITHHACSQMFISVLVKNHREQFKQILTCLMPRNGIPPTNTLGMNITTSSSCVQPPPTLLYSLTKTKQVFLSFFTSYHNKSEYCEPSITRPNKLWGPFFHVSKSILKKSRRTDRQTPIIYLKTDSCSCKKLHFECIC